MWLEPKNPRPSPFVLDVAANPSGILPGIGPFGTPIS
jgi:hypothetical protein